MNMTTKFTNGFDIFTRIETNETRSGEIAGTTDILVYNYSDGYLRVYAFMGFLYRNSYLSFTTTPSEWSPKNFIDFAEHIKNSGYVFNTHVSHFDETLYRLDRFSARSVMDIIEKETKNFNEGKKNELRIKCLAKFTHLLSPEEVDSIKMYYDLPERDVVS
jgi:hypothetical protein